MIGEALGLVVSLGTAVVAFGVGYLSRPKALPPKKSWEPFEPGICSDLPEHEFAFESEGVGYRCPACTYPNGTKQPPYCAERGGHFHLKCKDCGYEYAVRAKTNTMPISQPAQRQDDRWGLS